MSIIFTIQHALFTFDIEDNVKDEFRGEQSFAFAFTLLCFILFHLSFTLFFVLLYFHPFKPHFAFTP